MDLYNKIQQIIKLSSSESEAEQLLMNEISQDNIFELLENEEIGVDIDELGLEIEDLDNLENVHKVEDNELETQNFAKAKTINLYRYVAHNSSGYSNDTGKDSRDFCRTLVQRTRISLMRYRDILRLNGSNKGMGMGGANVYNVFKWRGGVNCKHIWVKYVYNTETKSLVKSIDQPNQTGQGAVPNA